MMGTTGERPRRTSSLDPWVYPAIVKATTPADIPTEQTFGMLMTAVALDVAQTSGLNVDAIDPDDTQLHLDICVGDLAQIVGRTARRLGWIREVES